MGRRDAVTFTLQCAAEWRRLGATVTFEPGWETRGNGTSANYEGCLVHHTASPSSAANPNPTLRILIAGRPDLSGPLCNATIPWCPPGAPRIHVVAANPANHAGASGGRSMGPLPVTTLFNPRVFGCEIDYAGTVPMASAQRTAAFIFMQGTTRVLSRSIDYARAHFETSVTGKWDIGNGPSRSEDMAAFRRAAAAYIPPAPTPAPQPYLEDDVPYIIRAAGRADAVLVEGSFIGLSPGSDESKNWAAAGAKEVWVMPATWDAYANGTAFRTSPLVLAQALATTNELLAKLIPADVGGHPATS